MCAPNKLPASADSADPGSAHMLKTTVTVCTYFKNISQFVPPNHVGLFHTGKAKVLTKLSGGQVPWQLPPLPHSRIPSALLRNSGCRVVSGTNQAQSNLRAFAQIDPAIKRVSPK